MRKLLSLLTAILFATTMWGQAEAGTVLFSENFGGYSENDVPSGTVSTSTGKRVVYDGGSVTYASVNGKGTNAGNTKVMNAKLAGGTAPELMVGKKGTGTGAAGGTFTIAGIPSGDAVAITVSYKQNANGLAATITGTGYSTSFTSSATAGTTSFEVTVANGADATFTLKLQATSTSNVRVDDISITVKTAGTSCANKVAVSKGTPENGDFSLSRSGNLASCDAAVEVVVTPAPALHYKATGCTASNSTSISGPDGNGKYTVTYAQNTSTASVINVSFALKDVYTVTWTNNGVQSDPVDVYDEEQPEFPTPNPTSCDASSTTFIGWATTAWSGKVANLAGKTVYFEEEDIPAIDGANVEYFAVFAKAGVEASVSGGDMSSGATSGWTVTTDGTYSNNGLKFNAVDQYAQSPDLSESGYKDVTVKLKSGYNGSSGSVLTIASYDEDENVITSKTVTPNDTYTSQTTLYSVYLAGNKTIKYIRVTMTSKTSNLGMKYCEIFNTPKEDYMTTCAAAGTCETPKFSVVGDTYNAAQNVTLSCDTEGATIYYTTDGTDPDDGSTEYSEAIAVNTTNTTIKAIAYKDGMTESEIASATYVLQPSTPTISGDEEAIITANYFDAASIEITLSTSAGATIYYTTNGDDPTNESTEYTAPFNLTATATVKAVAIKTGWTNSEIAEQEYIKFAVTDCESARIAALSVANNNDLYNGGAEYSVSGYVTSITTAYDQSNNYMTFWMADVADGGNRLQAYRVVPESSSKVPVVGNRVNVTGQLTKYDSKAEFAAGCACEILSPTGFDNVETSVKAVKVLRNGVLYIEKAGKTYNAQGQLVK